MADNLKLAQGLRNLPASAREDLAGRAADIERGKTVELLRRAGKEMYDNPIVNTAIGFTPVLGDVQAAGETLSALNRGAPWQETAGYAAGMLPFVPMIGKTVWHGSPHTFDKFDLSKIGTGEGAQAYGHGLYLAEARPTAEEYKNKLTSWQFHDPQGNVVDTHEILKNPNVRSVLQKTEGNIDEALARAKQVVRSIPGTQGSAYAMDDINTLNTLKEAGGITRPEGSLYKVDLPDEQIAKMLDWDKPLSEQPENVRALMNIKPEEFGWYHKGEGMYGHPDKPGLSNSISIPNELSTGEDVHDYIRSLTGSYEKAAPIIAQRGVPGIQYLDQASRGAGEGTRNYVVFSDEIPQILERNNQPLVSALRQPKEMPISDLKLNEYGEAIAKSNIGRDKNFVSQNTNPISVVRLPSGEPYVLDGYHRLELAKRAGQENIQAKELPLTEDIKQMLINDKIIGQE